MEKKGPAKAKKESVSGMRGYTDKPVKGRAEDLFDVGKYIVGLSSFIQECDTPMTIAVQGDWGSGKTSFMHLIEEEIGEKGKTLPIWFNTWLFSQFNLGERLPMMLISRLSAALKVKGKEGEILKNSLSALCHLAASAADSLSGLDISGTIKEFKGDGRDVTEVLDKLRSQFQDCVKQALAEQKKERVVIFVDDLDRLQPARAVELLEVLKLFLDCDDCVFVLAIDYEVVSQGVRQKYGDLLGQDKGRSFFDKIIQVPFKMPVAHYDVETYVKKALEKMDLKVDCAGPYVDLIRASIGYNPRGMKRLLNAFLLLQKIHGGEGLESEFEKRLLFAVLCLQLSYEEIYNFVVRNYEDLEPDFFRQLTDPDTYANYLEQVDSEQSNPQVEQLFDEWGLNANTDVGRVIAFMQSFYNALLNEKKELTDEELGRLGEILHVAATTASESPLKGTVVVANQATGKGIRYLNQLEETANYHKIDEKIVYDSKKKLPGWNGCEVRGGSLFGESYEAAKFNELLCRTMSRLYQRDPERFLAVREDAKKYKLSSLFQGSGGSFHTPNQLEGVDIQVETYSSNQQKVSELKRLMKAMNYDPGELKILARLATRVEAGKE